MSSKKTKPQSSSYYFSPEECQEMYGDFLSRVWQTNIPDHHKEILVERITRDCEIGLTGRPWEEFERELLERLMKG